LSYYHGGGGNVKKKFEKADPKIMDDMENRQVYNGLMIG
jgi:hypothetical protein